MNKIEFLNSIAGETSRATVVAKSRLIALVNLALSAPSLLVRLSFKLFLLASLG
jgi:hypothetical protein